MAHWSSLYQIEELSKYRRINPSVARDDIEKKSGLTTSEEEETDEGTNETESCYAEEDFMSSNGMQTAIWGPVFWMALHLTSFNYPGLRDTASIRNEEERNVALEKNSRVRDEYRTWLLSIGKILPCKYCRDNFDANMERAGYDERVFDTRQSFSRFVYRLHNEVNRMLNKSCDLTYEEVRHKYEGFRARCGRNDLEKGALEKSCTHPLYNGGAQKCKIDIQPREV